jgi:hypothetical protein
MEIRRIGVPKPLVGGLGAISRVLRLALAWWVRRLERQLEQFSSTPTLFNSPRQLLRRRQRSAEGQACPNAKWTFCGAFCR